MRAIWFCFWGFFWGGLFGLFVCLFVFPACSGNLYGSVLMIIKMKGRHSFYYNKAFLLEICTQRKDVIFCSNTKSGHWNENFFTSPCSLTVLKVPQWLLTSFCVKNLSIFWQSSGRRVEEFGMAPGLHLFMFCYFLSLVCPFSFLWKGYRYFFLEGEGSGNGIIVVVIGREGRTAFSIRFMQRKRGQW